MGKVTIDGASGSCPRPRSIVGGLILSGLLSGGIAGVLGQSEAVDPTSWGSDHVGKPVPDYVVGDECLFCHRNDVGPSWQANRHQQTITRVDKDVPAWRALVEASGAAVEEAEAQMGHRQVIRYLKPNGRYGQYALWTTSWILDGDAGDGHPGESPGSWDAEHFGQRCAGCHATAVDSERQAFSSPALDCYTCHGAIDITHGSDTSRILFSEKRIDTPREEISICGSCHIRNGRSRSTGLPYPNNFVAGDNLFKDFAVDLSPETIEGLDATDRHVLDTVRRVAFEGRESVTCVTCHTVHGRSTERHAALRFDASCTVCHFEEEPRERVRPLSRFSALCEY